MRLSSAMRWWQCPTSQRLFLKQHFWELGHQGCAKEEVRVLRQELGLEKWSWRREVGYNRAGIYHRNSSPFLLCSYLFNNYAYSLKIKFLFIASISHTSQLSSTQLNSTQLNSTLPHSTQLNSTQLNSTQLDSTQLYPTLLST